MGMNLRLMFMLVGVPDLWRQSTVGMRVMAVVMSMRVSVGESRVFVFMLVGPRQHEDKGDEHDAPGSQLFRQDGLLQQYPRRGDTQKGC